MMNKERRFEPLNLMPYTKLVYSKDEAFMGESELSGLSYLYQVVYDSRTGEEVKVYLTKEFLEVLLDTALELVKAESQTRYLEGKDLRVGANKDVTTFEL